MIRKEYRISGRGIIFSVIIFLVPGISEASLSKALEYFKKLDTECTNRVVMFLSDDSSRLLHHSAVGDLGEVCERILSDMTKELRTIGVNFQDSDNRTWADSVKRNVVSASDLSERNAQALKRYRSEEKDSKSDLEALMKSLKDTVNEFVKCHEEHKKQLEYLRAKVEEANKKYKEASADDIQPYLQSLERVNKAWEEWRQMEQTTSNHYKRTAELAKNAENLRQRNGSKEELNRAYNEMVSAGKDARDSQKKTDEKYEDLKKLEEASSREAERFINEAKASAVFFTGEVERLRVRAGEFVREFEKPIM